MKPKTARDWKALRPTGLRESMDACKDHAASVLGLSVQRLADNMGVSDHWSLYKWFQNGRMPVNLVRPFERACGQNYVTRWLVASGGMMTIDIPTGRKLKPNDFTDLHAHFAETMRLLSDYYAEPTNNAEVLAALNTHMEHVGWHRLNVAQHIQPQLEL